MFFFLFFCILFEALSFCYHQPLLHQSLKKRALFDLPSSISVSIEERTTSCLDWKAVVDAIHNNCVTSLGSEKCDSQIFETPQEINHAYSMIDEMSFNLEYIPLRSKMDVSKTLYAIDIGSSPERDDLSKFTEVIEEVTLLRKFIIENKESLSLYQDLAKQMIFPDELVTLFENAFDDENQLNGDKFPIIGKLRKESESLKQRIIQMLQNILKSPAFMDKIADNMFVELEGRYCILLYNTYKKGVGIVHGASNTGRTVYVEPYEVVDPTNDLKTSLEELKTEENKILFEMCRTIAKYRTEIRSAISAVAEVDLFRAKAKLGKLLRGVIPQVGNEGIFRCEDARHPVLALRGVDPVGNSLELNNEFEGMVISGPNAGGKTIVLKTAGLFCLMVRHAIPVPAARRARVDVMQVMADIGDMQSVSGDLSTFSGHLVVCREMLVKAKSCAGNMKSLVLLDEIGTGTDPAQGAALAQAVLEELLNIGCRVIVTTHYQRIKELAANDPRFHIAAMEFVDNRPTYRLRLGFVGESYALEAARRMGLPENVLVRADSLLDNESRRILALQKKLEEETDKAREKQMEFENMKLELKDRENKIEDEKKNLEEQIKRLKAGKTEEFLTELKAKELELQVLLSKAQEALLQDEMRKSDKEKIVEEAKLAMRSIRLETETAVVREDAVDLGIPLEPGVPIDEGQTLVVLERGTLFGSKGVVTRKNKGRGRVQLRVAGAEVKIERHLLGIPKNILGLKLMEASALSSADIGQELSAKEKRMMKILQEELVDPSKMLTSERKNRSKGRADQRSPSNTLDIRGFASEEAQIKVSNFLQKMMDDDAVGPAGVCYINHGNKGPADAVKPKLRSWLKKHGLVRKVTAADLSEGGDACTVVELIDDLDD